MKHPGYYIILLISLLLSSACNKNTTYTEFNGYAQGGTYHIVCLLPEDTDKEKVAKAIEDTLMAIDNSLSGYNKGSLLSKINAGEDLPLDKIMEDLFTLSKEIWKESQGSFDPSAAPLFKLWGFGFDKKENITQSKIDSVLTFVGMDKIWIEKRSDGSVHFVKKDKRITLNFNAIAQGYTCDAVSCVLNSWGSSDYIIELGGEIVCKGKNPNNRDWRIWIDKPLDGNNEAGKMKQDIISTTNCGLVTSGNYRKFYIENGHKYSHTIDPSTGYPVQHTLLSATIIAKDGATADAYATWLMVAGLEDAKKIISQRKDISGYFVYGEQDDMKVWHTPDIKLDSKKREINNYDEQKKFY